MQKDFIYYCSGMIPYDQIPIVYVKLFVAMKLLFANF